MSRKVIFDCDPGVDDALAISAIYQSAGIEVLGICIVGGNRPLDVVYKNALRLNKYFNKHIKVYLGVENMSNAVISDSSFHGASGFGAAQLPYDEQDLVTDEDAVSFMARMLHKYPNEIEIVAIGPVTNLAKLVLEDKEAFDNIKAIYSMGGTFSIGNITPYCEFNYYFDHQATEIVMNALNEGKVEFHMFPLDITAKVKFDLNEFAFLKFEGGKWGEIVWDMFRTEYLHNSWSIYHIMGCVLHDLVAAMYLLDDSYFDKTEPVKVTMNHDADKYGQLLKESGKTKLYVHYDVDSIKLKEEYLNIIYGEKIVGLYKNMKNEIIG